MPAEDELPGTLQRSPKKAQRTWSKAHDSAVETYSEGERAHRAAFSALKHQFEKVGDHWEPKGGKGPSDPRAKHPRAREDKGRARPAASTSRAAPKRSCTSGPRSSTSPAARR